MPGPTLAGKVTLDDSQASAALRRLETIGAAAAAKLNAGMGGAFKGLATTGTAAVAKLEAGVTGRVKNMLAPIAAIGPAIAAAFAGKAIVAGTAQVFEAGRGLQILSRQTGASIYGLAILQTKFKQAGIDADGVGTAIFRLQKSINGLEDDENKGGPKAVRELGLEVEKLRDMKPDQQLFAVGAAMSKISDPAERTATAMKIFGKSGAELNAVFGPNFAQVAPGLQQKAAMMAKNAAIFEQVSIKLQKVGGILKTFYVGVADSVGKEMIPYLDRLEKINLVSIGQRFGKALADGGKMLVGAFELPESAFAYIQNGLALAFTSSGNVLLAALKSGAEFFQTGMLASLQAIGGAVISTLIRSFESPIAYLQSGIERAMRPLTVKQDLEQVTSLKKERDDIAAKAQGRPFTAAEQSHVKAVAGQISEIQNRYRSPLTIRERAAQIQKEGVRFGIYGGGQTAEQWGQMGRDKLQEAFGAAKTTARNFKIEDVLGASKYQDATTNAALALRQQGQKVLGGGGASSPAGTTTGTPTTGLSKLEQARLTAQAHMALVASHAPAGADPEAFMFLGHSGMSGTARTNATDPYTARVDAARRASMAALHTIGIGGALDFDPSTQPGWTGASNFGSAFSKKDWANFKGTSGGVFQNSTSLTTGGLGGGAYGATGNIWSQVSGRVQNSRKPPDQHLAEIAKNTADIASGVKGGTSTAGGSAPTTTGK